MCTQTSEPEAMTIPGSHYATYGNMAAATDTSANLYLPKITKLMSTAVQALAQNSSAATPRFDNPMALESANKHEQPIAKLDPKELHTTRCPGLSSSRTSSAESARLSSSQNSGCKRQDGTSTSPSSPPVKRGLKSILNKKLRSFQTTRHQVHPHPGPMLQCTHLNHPQRLSHQPQLQRLQQQQPQQPPPPPQQQQPPQQQPSQQQHYIPQQYNHGSPLSQKHTHLNLNNTTTAPSKILLRKSTKVYSRPLPTPPITKHVRWSTHNEVFEIQNIDDLILLGYYDDYDSELGWDYRDESQECPSSEDDEETSASLGDISPDYGSDTESETSAMNEESEIAEDELIQRFSSMDGFFPSIASSLSQNILNNSRSSGTSSLMTPSLPPRAPSPAILSMETTLSTTEPLEHPPLPPRLKSPPPPHSKHTLSLTMMPSPRRHQEKQHCNAFGSFNPIAESDQGSEATSDFGRVLKGKAPRLDRHKILAEVAERKQNGIGTFARRAGSHRDVSVSRSSVFESSLFRVDAVSSVSSSVPSTDSTFALSLPISLPLNNAMCAAVK
ncbi:hypothetical protein BGX26_001107 [Mortierella sp. AD094]|nr:hypothetical protein BGX26_001107 [Mortierella sp. AD094]